MLNKFRGYLVSKAYILFTVVVLGSVAGIGYAIIKLDRDNHMSAVRQDVEQALYEATDQIRLRFFEVELVANKIENLLSVSGEIPEKKIARVVEDLQKNIPGVIAVALAPGLEITHSFPKTSNKSTVGLKYWEIPDQMSSVARAYRGQSPVVDGPLPLVQGGDGYILRYPVFLQKPNLSADQFWGMISVVLQEDGLLSAQQHDFSDTGNYEFSLRELDASAEVSSGPSGEFVGLGDHPVTADFTLLGNTWQAAARPAGGWPSYSPQSPYLLGFAFLSALILVGVLWAFRNLALKKENAHRLLVEAIDCISEGFIAFDDRERLVMVNQKYLDYHSDLADHIVAGTTMEELLRLGVAHYQYPAALGREEEWIEERLERFRNPGTSLLTCIDDKRWLKVTEAKTPHGYTVGIRTDVTAEKRAQEAAEAADREKTEFLNNVSHELRTPLTVISGRASFLRNSEKLPQSRRVLAALEEDAASTEVIASAVGNYQRFVSEQGAGIADSAQHMLRLVEDLLDWTKVARGQLELDRTIVQVGEVAESVVEDLRPHAEAKGLTLTYATDGAAEAMADRIRLKQILYNLISNAIKFTETGGIHLSITHTGDRITFCVADTGCGISKDDLNRVFQRFQQVDGSMSRRNGGLGLGLAIAQQLTALHGGDLSVESTVGKGSTFRLNLPPADEVIALRKSA